MCRRFPRRVRGVVVVEVVAEVVLLMVVVWEGPEGVAELLAVTRDQGEEVVELGAVGVVALLVQLMRFQKMTAISSKSLVWRIIPRVGGGTGGSVVGAGGSVWQGCKRQVCTEYAEKSENIVLVVARSYSRLPCRMVLTMRGLMWRQQALFSWNTWLTVRSRISSTQG